MEIITLQVPVTTTGSAGSATGSATSVGAMGPILDIYLDYHASAPATTDVTIAYATRGGNILVVSNNATDTLYQPVKQNVDSAGAAITGMYGSYVLADALTVSVAGCDALTNAVVAYIRVLRI